MNIQPKKKYFFLIILLAGLVWMIVDATTQPGPEKLRGGFERKAFIRNEQNTGPVIRIYAVAVNDSLWREMEAYGNFMPHSKYGTTRVYYFLSQKLGPTTLRLEDPNIEAAYQQLCIARYEKNPMGQASLMKYPFSGAK